MVSSSLGPPCVGKEPHFDMGNPPPIVTRSEVGPNPVWSDPMRTGHGDEDIWERKMFLSS